MIALEGAAYLHLGGDGVHPVRLSVAPGEVVALVGLNGAGKTTLMRLVLGMLRPQVGRVLLLDRQIVRLPRAAWRDVGHLVDGPLAYPELSTQENLRVAALLHDADPAHLVPRSLAQWQLEAIANRSFSRLSLGNRQRVGLAGALQHRPRVVVLDEPSSALDPAAVLILRAVLAQLAAEGSAVLISSHHLDEVARVADRILIMNAGRIVGRLDPGGIDLERAFFDVVRRDDDRRAASEAGAP